MFVARVAQASPRQVIRLEVILLVCVSSVIPSRDASVDIYIYIYMEYVMGFDKFRFPLGQGIFSKASRPSVGPTQSPIHRVPGAQDNGVLGCDAV
jgi:hypothetical protein